MRSGSEREKAEAARELANWGTMDPQFASTHLVSACEQLKLPALLSSMLSSSSASTQAAATSLLGALGQYPEYADAMEDANALSPLLANLRGSKPELVAKAATALVSLTASLTGRAQLRAANGLSAVLDVLMGGAAVGSANPEVCEAVCNVLANLCDDEGDDWREMAQAGAVFALCGQLSSSHPQLHEAVLTLLAMLCAHPECRDQAADANAMPSLVRLLGSNKAHVQRVALALTQQLCGSKRACDALLDAGCASPLAALLSSSAAADVEVSAPTRPPTPPSWARPARRPLPPWARAPGPRAALRPSASLFPPSAPLPPCPSSPPLSPPLPPPPRAPPCALERTTPSGRSAHRPDLRALACAP